MGWLWWLQKEDCQAEAIFSKWKMKNKVKLFNLIDGSSPFQISVLSDPPSRSCLCSLFIAAALICSVYFIGSSFVAKENKEVSFYSIKILADWYVADCNGKVLVVVLLMFSGSIWICRDMSELSRISLIFFAEINEMGTCS